MRKNEADLRRIGKSAFAICGLLLLEFSLTVVNDANMVAIGKSKARFVRSTVGNNDFASAGQISVLPTE